MIMPQSNNNDTALNISELSLAWAEIYWLIVSFQSKECLWTSLLVSDKDRYGLKLICVMYRLALTDVRQAHPLIKR